VRKREREREQHAHTDKGTQKLTSF